ncbi:MAG TPA: DUF3363 domain-containing protein [Bryobacteraceae bacterium]|nr:DUF3363 domain-containing protein [Bryobacteraceae bacterium]
MDQIIARTTEPLPDATERRMVRVISRATLGKGQHRLAARLAVLEDMGLAERIGPDAWTVRTDFEAVLRAMQRTNDRQRVMAAHGAVVSDERLPIEVLDFRKATIVEGRILVHGEDEQSGRQYLMLEGTDAQVHFIHYSTEIVQARARGKLSVNSFARLRRITVGQESKLQIDDLGGAESLLHDREQLDATARNLIRRGIIPIEDGWGGWLGRYQAALRRAAVELEYEHPAYNREKARRRSHGR